MRISPGVALGSQLPWELAAAMRSSIFYLAPLLHKTGRVTMPMPGGCRLGPGSLTYTWTALPAWVRA